MTQIIDPRRDDYFDEDFVEGAVASLRLSTNRIQCRRETGEWPRKEIGVNRKTMEGEIERLILAEIDRRSRREVTQKERSGPVVHYRRRGRDRMKPKN